MHSLRSGPKTPWNLAVPRSHRRSFTVLLLCLLAVAASSTGVAAQSRLDSEIAFQAARDAAASRTTRAIVMLRPGAALPDEFAPYATRRLAIINGYVLDVDNNVLTRLAASASVAAVHADRPATKFDYRTSLTVGSLAVNQSSGFTGSGVGVAVIDSGVASWHDDLTSRTQTQYPFGNQRVTAFVDFVGGSAWPYDDNGHGSHVAGIIAGNGFDSNGLKAGAAPDADLVALKVLDADGRGSISNVIAALDWVLEHRAAHNIRVVNLSVGAAVHESYLTDPLTLAAKRVVDSGVVVVSAAGNFGKNADGLPQYGGINAPGNAPWVLTVGASTTNGTLTRSDDTTASFSSSGPTYLDWAAKPDLVAPGVGTVSLADPISEFYASKAPYLVSGSFLTAFQPYLSLSGTSMAAPVVSGTIALMLQANPALTPNAVKAILQYTSQSSDSINPLTQGAGFLNALGAVRLARYYAHAKGGDRYPGQSMWSKHIVWGNHMLSGGVILPTGNAWAVGTTWGAAKTSSGDNIVWGTQGSGDNIVWGTAKDGDNIVWGTAKDGDNIVWGTAKDGDNIVWGTANDGDNIVWGTAADGDNIVWGTSQDGDNIVWGTDCGGNDCTDTVWGAENGDNIVWGTAANGDNIVWGTNGSGDNIVWGTVAGDNIVWGTDSGDNIVWGTATDGDNIVWGTVDSTVFSWVETAQGTPMLVGNINDLTDEQVFAVLSHGPAPVAPPPITLPPDDTIHVDPEHAEPLGSSTTPDPTPIQQPGASASTPDSDASAGAPSQSEESASTGEPPATTIPLTPEQTPGVLAAPGVPTTTPEADLAPVLPPAAEPPPTEAPVAEAPQAPEAPVEASAPVVPEPAVSEPSVTQPASTPASEPAGTSDPVIEREATAAPVSEPDAAPVPVAASEATQEPVAAPASDAAPVAESAPAEAAMFEPAPAVVAEPAPAEVAQPAPAVMAEPAPIEAAPAPAVDAAVPAATAEPAVVDVVPEATTAPEQTTAPAEAGGAPAAAPDQSPVSPSESAPTPTPDAAPDANPAGPGGGF